MDNTAQHAIKDILASNDTLAIAVGRNPGVDEMGAALALYLSLKTSGKHVSIATPNQPLVEVSSLVGIDKVKTQFENSGGDLIVSFPYKEGEIDKVSYTLEEGYLNIVVKAGQAGLSFTEKDVQFKRGGSSLLPVLFVVGTPRLSDLGNLFNAEALKNTTIINIDNNQDNQGFGDIVMVSPSSSSVSEIIANLLLSGEFPVDLDIAQNLLAGIGQGTSNFQKPNTTALAFEVAGSLMKKGAMRPKPTQSKPVVSEDAFGLMSSTKQQGVKFPDMRQNRSSFPKMPAFSQQQPIRQNPMPQRPAAQGTFMRQSPKPDGQTQNRPAQPQQNPMPQQVNKPIQEEKPAKDEEEAPSDWLTPKIYKGSTTI